jgi:hypothetical protein
MPLLASNPGLIYFQVGFVISFIVRGGIVCTGLDVSLYQASPKRYIDGAKELHEI